MRTRGNRMRWTVNLTNSPRSGTRYNLKLFDRWGTSHVQRSFRRAGIRRLADALQDAADGHSGPVHEWQVSQSVTKPHWVIVAGDKLRVSLPAPHAQTLLESIDNLLED